MIENCNIILKRITLSVLKPEMVGIEYCNWMNNKTINKYLESRFKKHTIDSLREFLTRLQASDNDLLFGIFENINGCHIGNIKIGLIDRNHGLGEIGILIGDKSYWGRGYGREVINGIAEYAKENLGLRKLTAGAYSKNIASIKAFTNAGFCVECVRKRQYLLDGEEDDMVLMSRFVADE